MISTVKIVQGWTAELPAFTLKANGQPLDLTGFLAEQIVAKIKKVGAADYVDTLGQVRIDADPTTGKVYFKPEAADFVGGNHYDLRFAVTDGAGGVEYFPNADPNRIVVGT